MAQHVNSRADNASTPDPRVEALYLFPEPQSCRQRATVREWVSPCIILYTGCTGGWNSRRCINSASATAGEVTCPCVFVAFCNTTVIKSTAFIFEKLWWKGKKITLNPIWSIHILRCYCPYTAWQGLELMRMDYYTQNWWKKVAHQKHLSLLTPLPFFSNVHNFLFST